MQTIVGALVAIVFLPFSRVQKYRGMIVLYHPFAYTIALGTFAFVSDRASDARHVRGRVYGHFVQSCLFGPLFFFVVSLPQLFVRIPWIRRYRAERGVEPTDLYTDRQAARCAARFGE